ncbi:MAG: ATP-grasp domain-containing protein [Burkholderiaceae bacterium]
MTERSNAEPRTLGASPVDARVPATVGPVGVSSRVAGQWHRAGDASAAMRDLLLLFDFDWDTIGLTPFRDRFRFFNAGFDLFSFPGNARLLWFDIERFVDRLVERYGGRIDGVISANEQFGALAAALIAERLGLPGTNPDAILACQHKYHLRQLVEQVAPEANIGYRLLPCELGGVPYGTSEYPSVVKPIKAAYSVLARRIENEADLVRHIRFGPLERFIIARLVKPFDDIARRRLRIDVDARHMLVEEAIEAEQFNLDGYVYRGQPVLIGAVDELMYPGTQAFLRFAYPSRLSAEARARAFDIATRVLRAAGFDHGFFNMEFFHDPKTGEVKVIEINPRLASQLADLYERVDGIDIYGMTLALACGEDPARVPRKASRGGAAASCVLRSFGDAIRPTSPISAVRRQRVAEAFPEAIVMDFHKRGASLAREVKWLGSHRYGVVNLHGDDEPDLRRRFEAICAMLGWPAPY